MPRKITDFPVEFSAWKEIKGKKMLIFCFTWHIDTLHYEAAENRVFPTIVQSGGF